MFSYHQHRNVQSDALLMSAIDTRPLPHPEAIVGYGFRYIMNASAHNRSSEINKCIIRFQRELEVNVLDAVKDLTAWGDAIRECSLRKIKSLPTHNRTFCRDECLAVTLVAASPHRNCPALQICAQILLGTDNIEPVLETAHVFHETLSCSGLSFTASPSGLTHSLH